MESRIAHLFTWGEIETAVVAVMIRTRLIERACGVRPEVIRAWVLQIEEEASKLDPDYAVILESLYVLRSWTANDPSLETPHALLNRLIEKYPNQLPRRRRT